LQHEKKKGRRGGGLILKRRGRIKQLTTLSRGSACESIFVKRASGKRPRDQKRGRGGRGLRAEEMGLWVEQKRAGRTRKASEAKRITPVSERGEIREDAEARLLGKGGLNKKKKS